VQLARGQSCVDCSYIGHKWFNVPYASGIFYTRSLALLKSVFGPSPRYPPPAYLTPVRFDDPIEPLMSSSDAIPSPLHTNLENSRRFIALPLFAALLSLGRRGYAELVERNVRFARDVAAWMNEDGGGRRWYEVLNLTHEDSGGQRTVPLNVVLFRARTGAGHAGYLQPSHGAALLCKAINSTRRMYTSPTVYQGVASVRIAVSNWGTELPLVGENGEDSSYQGDRNWDSHELNGMSDYEVVCKTLQEVMVDPPGFVRECNG
jgi:glutamate/tyrosine decarboxylase-like PLP-dependent enzyme